jgi:hypothetical protein
LKPRGKQEAWLLFRPRPGSERNVDILVTEPEA